MFICTRGIERQLISEEDISVAVEGRAESESEIKAAQVQSLQTKCDAKKILQTETANADRANSLTKQKTVSYQHAQC
jgi:hypothetical protein